MAGPRFNAENWLDRWIKIGGVVVTSGGASLSMELDGNAAEQRLLLGRLDGKRGRREAVRDLVIARIVK